MAKKPPTLPEVVRAYLGVLKGKRTNEVLAAGLGYKKKNVGHLLNGKKVQGERHFPPISDEALQTLCERWDIAPRLMIEHLAMVAKNLENGDPPGKGLGGVVYGPESASEADEDRAHARE